MEPAGGRLHINPHVPRGVAIITPSSSSPYRENAKDALFGGGPQKSPNTPLRGVGGNSSMSGILSTPTAVPLQSEQQNTPRTTGRGFLGLGNKSQLDLKDDAKPAAGQRATRESQSTRSTLQMTSGDLDDTPLRTGKGFTTNRTNVSTFQLGPQETPPPQARPQTAATGAKNRGTFSFGDSVPTAELQPAGQVTHRGVARPSTASSRSDIFFTGQNAYVAPARAHDLSFHSQKAHIHAQNIETSHNGIDGTDDGAIDDGTYANGLPNMGMNTSRKNQESSNLFIGGSQVARQVPDSEVYGRSHTSAYAAPPQANGSLIPQLKLPTSGNGYGGSVAPTAGLTSRDRFQEDPMSTGLNTRRAYGNAKNSSSLFQTDAMAQLQPKQLEAQIPEVPPQMKQHLKIVRAGTKDASVKNLLVWQ